MPFFSNNNNSIKSKPSVIRKRIRSEYKFANSFTPFLLEQQPHNLEQRLSSQLPKIPLQLGQSILEFIDSFPLAITTPPPPPPPIETCQLGIDFGKNILVKPKSSARKKSKLKQQPHFTFLSRHRRPPHQKNDNNNDNDQDEDEDEDDNNYQIGSSSSIPSDVEEVQLVYNKSNTPKYLGQFINVYLDNRLKRQCKSCPAMYTDLKGFNRHYESKHL